MAASGTGKTGKIWSRTGDTAEMAAEEKGTTVSAEIAKQNIQTSSW